MRTRMSHICGKAGAPLGKDTTGCASYKSDTCGPFPLVLNSAALMGHSTQSGYFT